MASPDIQALAPALAAIPQISDAVLRDVDRHRDAFLHADPFKHVAIENFFEPLFAERLLADFPSFNPHLAKNEVGLAGGKAVNTNIRQISSTYQELYELIAAQPFLEFVSRLSGIPDLILDPKMYGGGTHDNRHGQELDPHVDFNYDEAEQLHRRLNLIVYMNPEWRSEWGGALEIHSNPRDPGTNRIKSYAPLFNRAVMFETNEFSWHAFPKIDLPEGKRHLSRKSISIYLYTKDRPAEEIAPMHGTFYVQRPLAPRFAPGHMLTEQDIDEIRRLIGRRDHWIEVYQRMELEKNREIAGRTRVVQDLTAYVRAPLTGYILQVGPSSGLYADGWVGSQAELQIRPIVPVSELVLRGHRLDGFPPGRLRLSVESSPDNVTTAVSPLATGPFEIIVPLPQVTTDTLLVKLVFESEGARTAAAGDDRDLAFFLAELRARHPGIPEPDDADRFQIKESQ
jgi:hypothetical protein